MRQGFLSGADVIRWTTFGLLGLPAALLLCSNWLGLTGHAIRSWRAMSHDVGGYSFAPPWLAGIVGAIACLACPSPAVRHCAWVPLVLDPSISLMAVAAAIRGIGRAFAVGREPRA